MRESKKELLFFCLGFILAFIYWRTKVLLYYQRGGVSFLREITGLSIHHYHFGVLILTIFLLLYLFYRRNNLFIGLIGFGLGSILDSFVSRLFSSGTRVQEIINYQMNFYNTLLIFGIVIVLSVIFYLMKDLKSFGINYRDGRKN